MVSDNQSQRIERQLQPPRMRAPEQCTIAADRRFMHVYTQKNKLADSLQHNRKGACQNGKPVLMTTDTPH